MKICSRCNIQKSLNKFKKYTTKNKDIRFVSNCLECASLDLKLENKNKKQLNPFCKHCNIPLDSNNWHASMKKECCYVCKTCHKSYKSQSFEVNKNSKLTKKYKITYEEFLKLKEEQNNVCKICKKTELFNTKNKTDSMNLAVDHCHITGKIRGLLCLKCNRALGLFEDSIDNLNQAIQYLKDGH